MSWQGLDFDFTGVVFDGGDFTDVRFSDGIVLFTGAEFSGGAVDFYRAKFSGSTVDFYRAKFSGSTVGFDRADVLRRHGRLHPRRVLRRHGRLHAKFSGLDSTAPSSPAARSADAPSSPAAVLRRRLGRVGSAAPSGPGRAGPGLRGRCD